MASRFTRPSYSQDEEGRRGLGSQVAVLGFPNPREIVVL